MIYGWKSQWRCKLRYIPNIVMLQIILTNMCNMCSSVVVSVKSTAGFHVWYDVRLQDLVPVTVSRQCTCHIYKGRPISMVDSCSHHDTPTTKTIYLLNTVFSVTLTATSIDTFTFVSMCEEKTGFICKQNGPPAHTWPSNSLMTKLTTFGGWRRYFSLTSMPTLSSCELNSV